MTCRPDRIFLAESHFSLELPCLRIVFPAVGHGVEVGRGPIIILVFNAAKHTIVPKPLTGRVVLDGMVVVVDGTLVVLLADTAKTAQLVLSGNVGIQPDGFRAVGLGSHIVIQVELGNATEEPGLVEKGLGGDGLVEILNGEHVVLIVESGSSGSQNTVDVVLGK